MVDQLTDHTKAAVEGAVKGVVENLGPFLKTLDELITNHFDRKEKKRKELAEVFASHLDDFANLLAKAAKKLEKGKGVGRECGMLQVLAQGLNDEVVAKVLKNKAKRKKILETALKAAQVERTEAELSGKSSNKRKAPVKCMREYVGKIQGLSQNLRLTFSLPPRKYQ